MKNEASGFQEYVVKLKFLIQDLGVLNEGSIVYYNPKTGAAEYNGNSVERLPSLRTAIASGWLCEKSKANLPTQVVHVGANGEQYKVHREHQRVGSTRRETRVKNGVEEQDLQEVQGVQIFSKANAGNINLADSGMSTFKRDQANAAAARLKNAQPPIPKIIYTEGVSIEDTSNVRNLQKDATYVEGVTIHNTSGTMRRSAAPSSPDYWDGGSARDVVGTVSRGKFTPKYAVEAPPEDDQEDKGSFEEEIKAPEPSSYLSSEDLEDRMGIILAALPNAHLEDVKLKVAILRALVPGFPEWDARVHWKTKVKEYHNSIEGYPERVAALRVIEPAKFWDKVEKGF
jgi:hypothetical protein